MSAVLCISLSVAVALVVVAVALGCTRETFVRNSDLDTIVAQLRPHFPVVERLSFYEGDKSYTINKENVYICMRDERGEYYDRNFLVYVVLHEISHALCDEIGHTDKFLQIFNQVLARAAALGVYDPAARKVDNYCNYRK